ncbi:hypothetical protein AAC387_Pa10g0357 [Persea americana]
MGICKEERRCNFFSAVVPDPVREQRGFGAVERWDGCRAIQGRGDETPNTSSNFLVAVPSEYTVIINKQERAFRAEEFFPGKRWSPHLAIVVEGTNWVIDIPFGTESGNEAYGHGLGMLKIRQISWSTKLTVHVILATSMQ